MILNFLIPLSKEDRAAIRQWAKKQPPQTLLLFIIVVGGGCSALFQFPAILDRMVSRLEKSHENTASRIEKVQVANAEVYERDQQRDDERSRRLEKMIEDFLQGRRPVARQGGRVQDVPL